VSLEQGQASVGILPAPGIGDRSLLTSACRSEMIWYGQHDCTIMYPRAKLLSTHTLPNYQDINVLESSVAPQHSLAVCQVHSILK